MGRRVVTSLVVFASLAAPGFVRADSLARLDVDTDGDGRTERVTVEDDGRLLVVGPGKSAELALGPGWRVASASLETAVYGQRRVVLARTIDVDGMALATLIDLGGGAPKSLWQGPVGPQGRDREWAIHVELGPDHVVRYESRDGVARCDGERSELYRRGFDFASGELRPLGWKALPVPAGAQRVVASRGAAPPGLSNGARPTVFRVSAASSSETDGGSAEGLTTPVEVDDGSTASAWIEGRGSDGRGEFVTFRSSARRFKVVALRLVPGDAKSATSLAAGNRPRRLLVVTDGGQSLVVDVDPDPASGKAPPGEPWWIVLPTPIEATCVSIVLDDVWPGDGSRRTAIAELSVFTDLDAGGGAALVGLADDVARGGPNAGAAEDLLVARGDAGAQALLDAARRPGRSAAELHRLRLALAHAERALGAAEVVKGLVEVAPAAGVPDSAAARDLALFAAGLAKMGDSASPVLTALLADEAAPLQARVVAAELLGPLAAPAARSALEAACGRGERALRQAVTLALGRRAPKELDLALAAAIAAAPPSEPALPDATQSPASASLSREADLWRVVALLTAHAQGGAERVADPAAARLGATTDYELRLRLVQTLAAAYPAARARTALTDVLAHEAEPAIRRVLIAALGRAALAGDAPTGALLIGALADLDPGVRAAAATALAGRSPDAHSDAPLARALGQDRWPEVRRAAADALGLRCARPAAAEALLAAVQDDGSGVVRRVALAALVGCREPRIGPLLLAVVQNRGLGADWRRYAASQLGALGDRSLVPRLVDVLYDLRRAAFGDDDVAWIAAAVAHSLGLLGDDRAENALIEAAADPSFPPIQAAAIEALAMTCPRRATTVFERGLDADDGAVVRAARLGRARCGGR